MTNINTIQLYTPVQAHRSGLVAILKLLTESLLIYEGPRDPVSEVVFMLHIFRIITNFSLERKLTRPFFGELG